MSNPERLCLDGPTGIPEELVVAVYDESGDAPRAVAVPRERDLATALSRCSDEWFERFLREMQKLSPVRQFKLVTTLALADVHALAGFVPAGRPVAYGVEGTDSAREYRKDVVFGGAVGDGFLADVAGGDADPGFGVDPPGFGGTTGAASPAPPATQGFACPVCRGSGNTGHLCTPPGCHGDTKIPCYACLGSGRSPARISDIVWMLAQMDDDWFVDLLADLSENSPNRSVALSRVAEFAQLRGGAPTRPRIEKELATNFGTDPEDSLRLRALYNAVDSHLGKEGRGDYATRIREAGEKLENLRERAYCQRKELRRLNRAERERSLTISLAHHQHSVYVDPQAEQRRIAHLVWSVAQLLEKHPTNFTDRSLAELREALSAWHQRLVAP